MTEELYSDDAGKLSDGTELGDKQWSHLLAFSTGGRETVVKQTAIRDGCVLLIVSGSPALVDRHLRAALTKATAGSHPPHTLLPPTLAWVGGSSPFRAGTLHQ